MAGFKVREGQRLQDYMNLEGLTDVQKAILQKYSRLRSASKSKQEFSNVLKAHGGEDALVSDYVFDGMVDTGYFGGSRCSRGHTLRYEFYAVNKENPNDVIIFGSSCVRDFFNISDAQMALIHQGVMEANKDIIQVIEKMIKYGSFDAYEFATDMWSKFNKIDTENLPEADQIKQFLINNLPLPNRFEYIINQAYFKGKAAREYAEWLEKNPQYKNVIDKAFMLAADDQFKQKHPDAHAMIESMTESLKRNRQFKSDRQETLLLKLLNTPWNELDPMVDGLWSIWDKVWEGYRNGALGDIMNYSYSKFGVTLDPNDPMKGQAGVIRKAYSKYEALIKKVQAAKERQEAEVMLNEMMAAQGEGTEEEEWVAN